MCTTGFIIQMSAVHLKTLNSSKICKDKRCNNVPNIKENHIHSVMFFFQFPTPVILFPPAYLEL